LKLGKEGSIIISNGAAAFALVADEMGITQLLCSYHFSLDLFSTTTQMNMILRDSYLTQCDALLYNAMPIATFEEKYQNLHSCLVNHPRAQKFVETLYRSKAKVVFAFVQLFLQRDVNPHKEASLCILSLNIMVRKYEKKC
jgi:hypothetical protein